MNLKSPSLRSPFERELLFTLATFLFLIPQPYLTIPALDASWQVVLEEAFYKGWEFGTMVNFTGGPLSFLYTPTSLGYHVFGQIALESSILILAIFLIFRALRGQAIWVSGLVFASLIISATVGKDGLYLVSVAAGAFILLREEDAKLPVLLIPAYLAVLSLMKFSFATLGLVCILILVTGALVNRDTRLATKLAGSYFGTLLLTWMVIGQNALTLPAFFINSFQISQGYLWNMNLHENASTFYFLLFFLLLCSVPIVLTCLTIRKQIHAWLSLAIAAGTIYLSWKAGINRAGSHMAFFLQAAFIVSIFMQPLVGRKLWSMVWTVALVASYLAGFVWIYPGGGTPIVSRTWNIFSGNLNFVLNPDSINQTYTRIIPMVIAENELPQIKARVGDSSIDVLHFQQSIVLLNDMNYVPRPTVQNYPAYNHHLQSLNLKHIRENPPEFIIAKYGLVDQRYPYCDDSLYNLEVFQNYKPVLTEKGYLLLERSASPATLSQKSKILEQSIQTGDNVDISAFSKKLLWLEADYRPSLMHRLLALFYKPEILVIRITLEDGTDKHFRLVGGNLKDGFLLNPLLEGDPALESFLNTLQPETRIASFTIVSTPDTILFRTKRLNLRLFALEKETAP